MPHSPETSPAPPHIEGIVQRAVSAYGLGEFIDYSRPKAGYEDEAAIIRTTTGTHFAKIFAEDRKPREITRIIINSQMAKAHGVRTPAFISDPAGHVIHTDPDTGRRVAFMEYINGKTLHDEKRPPHEHELDKILQQVNLIHQVPYEPPRIINRWETTQLHKRFIEVYEYIPDHLRDLIAVFVDNLQEVDTDLLPHSFVHSDLGKSNVMIDKRGLVHILDFSQVAWRPRIEDFAVIAANLMNGPSAQRALDQTVRRIIVGAAKAGEVLTPYEATSLLIYSRAAAALEVISAFQEARERKDHSRETQTWLLMSVRGLKRALTLKGS